MAREEKIDQIAGILARRDIAFNSRDDGAMLVRVGSTGAFIDVIDSEAGETIVSIDAPIALDISLKGRKAAAALEAANALNRDARFVRYVVYADDKNEFGTLRVEGELLGSNMQSDELMGLLSLVASAADELDDHVVADLGGKTLETLWGEDEDDEVEV